MNIMLKQLCILWGWSSIRPATPYKA